jgi:uncharacterized repeat protein (TIGR01451 family)
MTHSHKNWLLRPVPYAAATAVALLFTAGCGDDDDVDLEGQFIPVVQASDEMNTIEYEGDGIDIEKTMPTRIVMGQTVTYIIEIENEGEALSGLIIREELPEGFEFDSAEPQPDSVDGRMLTWRMSNIPADAEGAIQITGTPQAMGDLKACTTYEIDRGVCAMFTVVNPELRLTKMGPEMASICSPVEYVYTLENTGDSEAQDVEIYAMLPEGMIVADDGGREILHDVGTLQPGQSVEHRVMVKGSEADSYTSYAVARSDLAEVKSKRLETTFLAPELQVTAKSSNPFEYLGNDGRFEFTITNVGEVPAAEVVLATAVDANGQIMQVYGSEFEGEGEPRLASGRILDEDEAVLGELAPGESRTLFADVTIEDRGNVDFAVVAQALCRGSGLELAKADAKAQLEVRAIPALQLEVVDQQDPVRIGDETYYEITLINEGQAEDTNIVITGNLPDGAAFVEGQGVTEISSEGGEFSFVKLDRLPPQSSATWYIRIRADEANGGGRLELIVNSDNLNEELIEEEPTRLYGN